MTGGAPPPAPDSQDVMNQVLNQYFEEGEPSKLNYPRESSKADF